MNYFYLNSDLNTYTWNERSIYGEFYIEIGTIMFPYADWSDIISSVLDMWIDNTIHLLQFNYNSIAEFNFMDGPYYFNASCISNETLEIYLFSKNIKVNEKPYEISFYNFISELVKTTGIILKYEQIRDVSSIKELYKKYIKLKKLAKLKGYQL